MTKWKLMEILFNKHSGLVSICDSNGTIHTGWFVGLQREDGSGKSFNMTLRRGDGSSDTFHIRTSD